MTARSVRLIISAPARRDLEEIRRYLQPLSPSGLANVSRALEARMLMAVDNPSIGRPTSSLEIRELVEPRYGYIIPYIVTDGSILSSARLPRGA